MYRRKVLALSVSVTKEFWASILANNFVVVFRENLQQIWRIFQKCHSNKSFPTRHVFFKVNGLKGMGDWDISGVKAKSIPLSNAILLDFEEVTVLWKVYWDATEYTELWEILGRKYGHKVTWRAEMNNDDEKMRM